MTVKERVLDAVNAGMEHVDSIAIYTDSSEAYCRRICNKLADEGKIEKVCGRAHHTFLPLE